MPSQCMSISHNHVNPSHILQSPVSDKKNNRGWQAWRNMSSQDFSPVSSRLCVYINLVPHSSPYALQPRQEDVRTWQ